MFKKIVNGNDDRPALSRIRCTLYSTIKYVKQICSTWTFTISEIYKIVNKNTVVLYWFKN